MRPIQDWIGGARDEQHDRRGLGGGGRPAARPDPQRPRDPDSWSRSSPACIWAVIVLDLSLAGLLPAVRGLAGGARLLGDPPLPGARGRDAPGAARHQPSQAAPRLSAERLGDPAAGSADGRAAADQPDHRPGRRRAHLRTAAAARRWALDVLVAVAVATTISLELTVLLSKSILRPIADLQRATEAVARGALRRLGAGDDRRRARRAGRLVQPDGRRASPSASGCARRSAPTSTSRSPSTSSARGSRRRGSSVEVSVLVLRRPRLHRVRRQRGAPRRWSARLNELFEIVVPIVARHGGHVDKFVGDGLLAVFGAPEPYPDHADRAVRAACEIAARVNSDDGPGLRIGVGVNTGPRGRRLDRRRRTAQLQRHRRRRSTSRRGSRRRPARSTRTS